MDYTQHQIERDRELHRSLREHGDWPSLLKNNAIALAGANFWGYTAQDLRSSIEVLREVYTPKWVRDKLEMGEKSHPI